MKVVARFEIPFYQIMDEDSQIIDNLPNFSNDFDHLIRIYRIMVLIRIFDTKAIALQRTGKLGTYPSTRGQEAVFTGIGDAMQKTDILVPYYRDYAALFIRGVKLSEILLYWGGDERGNAFKCHSRDFPFSVPVGSQGLYAAGAAYALKLRKEKSAVLVTFGEGGTSEGDFYEAMNVAGVWQLPIVFAINNNQWAISVSRQAQSASETIAQKAIAAGFQGEQVDGNDVLAVRDRVYHALKKAREKNEPTLLEMLCYRHSDHTTADEARRYEPQGLREVEWKKEPVARMRRYLIDQGKWSDQLEEKLIADCTAEVEEAVKEYLNQSPANPETMIDYLYKHLPASYEKQRNVIAKLGMRDG